MKNIFGQAIDKNGQKVGTEFVITDELRGDVYSSYMTELEGASKFVIAYTGAYVDREDTQQLKEEFQEVNFVDYHVKPGHVGIAGLIFDHSAAYSTATPAKYGKNFQITENHFGGNVVIGDIKSLSPEKFVVVWQYSAQDFNTDGHFEEEKNGWSNYNPNDPSIEFRIFTVLPRNDISNVFGGPQTTVDAGPSVYVSNPKLSIAENGKFIVWWQQKSQPDVVSCHKENIYETIYDGTSSDNIPSIVKAKNIVTDPGHSL